MGKIFKALQKSEKQNTTKPVPRSGPDDSRKDKRSLIPPVHGDGAPHAGNQSPALNRERPEIKSVDPAGNGDAVAALDPHPPTAVKGASRPFDATPETKPPVKTDPMPAKNGFPRTATTPDPSVGPMSEKDGAAKPDGVSIALVKPETSLPSRAIEPGGRRTPAVEERLASGSSLGDAEPNPEVRVKYSRTKIQTHDPENLRNNKIFSVFDDMETTNQIKILRTQVLRKLKAIKGNSILVTSANPYEGKTFTSINLGVSIAKEFDRTVLIIDADIRKPTKQHTDFSTEFFSLKVDKGLTDYLATDIDLEEILINPGIDKLTLIPGGTPVNNSPELLNSKKMEAMIREIKSRYASDRLVIIDGPALLPFPDAVILSRYVDGVLPVVAAETTPAEDLKKMMNLLKDVNILGVVLNKNRE